MSSTTYPRQLSLLQTQISDMRKNSDISHTICKLQLWWECLDSAEVRDTATWACKKHLKGKRSYFMSVCVSFLICYLEYSSVTQVKVHIALDIVTIKMPALCYLNPPASRLLTPANSDLLKLIVKDSLPMISAS